MTTMLLDQLAPPIDNSTRREFLIGGLSLAALLAACGTPDAEAPPPSGSDDDRFPRTVAHKYGSTEVAPGDVYDATSFQTVLSLPFLLDRLVPMLAAAVDGDSGTEVPS